MNEEILLPNTEIPKNHIKDIVDVDPAKQPPQGMGCCPQIFRGKLPALPDDGYAALQRRRRFLQQFALPRAADQPTLLRTEIILREHAECGDQLPDSIAPARRDCKAAA